MKAKLLKLLLCLFLTTLPSCFYLPFYQAAVVASIVKPNKSTKTPPVTRKVEPLESDCLTLAFETKQEGKGDYTIMEKNKITLTTREAIAKKGYFITEDPYQAHVVLFYDVHYNLGDVLIIFSNGSVEARLANNLSKKRLWEDKESLLIGQDQEKHMNEMLASIPECEDMKATF
jgi:hypothetical protein